MTGTPHSGVWEGKRVKVKLKDGSWFVDRFFRAKGKFRLFEVHGKVAVGEIKSLTIWKGQDRQVVYPPEINNIKE